MTSTDPNHLTMIEAFPDQEALEEHRASSFYKDLMERLDTVACSCAGNGWCWSRWGSATREGPHRLSLIARQALAVRGAGAAQARWRTITEQLPPAPSAWVSPVRAPCTWRGPQRPRSWLAIS